VHGATGSARRDGPECSRLPRPPARAAALAEPSCVPRGRIRKSREWTQTCGLRWNRRPRYATARAAWPGGGAAGSAGSPCRIETRRAERPDSRGSSMLRSADEVTVAETTACCCGASWRTWAKSWSDFTASSRVHVADQPLVLVELGEVVGVDGLQPAVDLADAARRHNEQAGSTFSLAPGRTGELGGSAAPRRGPSNRGSPSAPPGTACAACPAPALGAGPPLDLRLQHQSPVPTARLRIPALLRLQQPDQALQEHRLARPRRARQHAHLTRRQRHGTSDQMLARPNDFDRPGPRPRRRRPVPPANRCIRPGRPCWGATGPWAVHRPTSPVVPVTHRLDVAEAAISVSSGGSTYQKGEPPCPRSADLRIHGLCPAGDTG